MSLSVTVLARRQITAKEKEFLSAYKTIGTQLPASDMPRKLKEIVTNILGFEPQYPEDVDVNGDIVEITVIGDGDAMYGGMIVDIASLPAGTTHLRIYVS